MPRRWPRLSLLACASLLAAWGVGCSTTPPPDVERRIAEAQRGLEGDPAVEARKQAVEAALARERSEPALDELELRVRGDHRRRGGELALRARIPVPDLGQVRARRAVRRA